LHNPDFEEPGDTPPGWRCNTACVVAISRENCLSGKQCAVLQPRSQGVKDDSPPGFLFQTFDAVPYRDREFHFRAAVRCAPGSTARLSVHIHRDDFTNSFYYNMEDRPIRSPEWQYYEIEGDVAPDAGSIDVGMQLVGPGAAYLDDVSFTTYGGEITEAAHPPTPQGLNALAALARLYGFVRYFHPSDEAARVDWNRFVISAVRTVEQAATPGQLAGRLQSTFAPVARTVRIFPTGSTPAALDLPPAPQVIAWEHHGLGGLSPAFASTYRSQRVITPASEAGDLLQPLRTDLPGGVTCLVPLALPRDGWGPPVEVAMAGTPTGSPNDRATRLAAVIIAWNVFQHFYPYFDVVRTDWAEVLPQALSAAAEDPDAHAFRITLQKMIAALHDGHGYLGGPGDSPHFIPPVIWTWAENRIVALWVQNGVDVKPGDAILSIDGQPATQVLAAREALLPGATPQCLRDRALSQLLTRASRANVRMELEPAAQPGVRRKVTLMCTVRAGELRQPRPEKVQELAPGIWYLDLDRITDADFAAAVPTLAKATGILFDLRGYPNNIQRFFEFFGHLVNQPVSGPRILTPLVKRPDRVGMTFLDTTWQAPPVAPYFTARKAFLTDARAISAAETLLSIVEHYKLAEIVGSPTAGTNGVVNPFALPGWYEITWTGMKVLKQDGSQHHGVGILPTIPVSLTRAGIAAGRDEVLERAVEAVKR